MTNFVDFDQEYGHRRDIPGYARALEAFDRRLPELIARLKARRSASVDGRFTATIPSWVGTDHTREQTPILLLFPGPQLPVLLDSAGHLPILARALPIARSLLPAGMGGVSSSAHRFIETVNALGRSSSRLRTGKRLHFPGDAPEISRRGSHGQSDRHRSPLDPAQADDHARQEDLDRGLSAGCCARSRT